MKCGVHVALDHNDRTDFDNAERGFVATLDPVTIKAADGRVIFDLAPLDAPSAGFAIVTP